MNPIRKVLQTRIENLVKLANVAAEVSHNATIGSLRESYLTDFFKELIPESLSITSGFLSDALGNITCQLDWVVTVKASLPLIAMQDNVSIIPVESALLVAEIKSTLNSEALKQVAKQNKYIAALRLSGSLKETEKFIIPTIILAFSSDLSEDSVRKWMLDSENGNTVLCCVIDKYTLIKNNDCVDINRKDSNGIRYYETLAFIAYFYYALEYLVEQRSFRPDWNNYLIGIPNAEQSRAPD